MSSQIHSQQLPHQDLSNLLKMFTSLTYNTVSTLAYEEAAKPQENDITLIDEIPENILAGPFETIELTASQTSLPVVACDMSTVKIAETLRGDVWAVKGSIIMKIEKRFMGTVVGPFVYNVSGNTVSKIIDVLLLSFGVERRRMYLDLNTAPKVISNLFEKVLQLYAATRLNGGLLLLDGALTSGPLDSPPHVVEKIVETVKTFGIGVAAFSKSTTLMLMGRYITSYNDRCKPPYVIKLPIEREKGMLFKNCSVYVSHLSCSLFPFRVDVASKTSDEEVFRTLLASENIIYGYPESLILAHQLAKLSRLEVLGLRARIESLNKVKFAPEIDVRSAIFAPLDGL